MKLDPESRPSLRLAWTLALPAYLADQASKWAIAERLAVHQDEIEIIPGFLWIHHVMNTGVAFGMANGGRYSNLIFGTIALLTCGGILLLWKKGHFHSGISRIAAALLIGGALGNVTDRILRGYVVDWITVDLQFMVWPSFNLADAYICIAATFLILSSFHDPSKASSEDRQDPGRKTS